MSLEIRATEVRDLSEPSGKPAVKWDGYVIRAARRIANIVQGIFLNLCASFYEAIEKPKQWICSIIQKSRATFLNGFSFNTIGGCDAKTDFLQTTVA